MHDCYRGDNIVFKRFKTRLRRSQGCAFFSKVINIIKKYCFNKFYSGFYFIFIICYFTKEITLHDTIMPLLQKYDKYINVFELFSWA